MTAPLSAKWKYYAEWTAVRACFISQRERIFCLARQKYAGILTDGKDF
jgi:hypothetical protein